MQNTKMTTAPPSFCPAKANFCAFCAFCATKKSIPNASNISSFHKKAQITQKFPFAKYHMQTAIPSFCPAKAHFCAFCAFCATKNKVLSVRQKIKHYLCDLNALNHIRLSNGKSFFNLYASPVIKANSSPSWFVTLISQYGNL